jgi:hypothetical protein
MPVWLELLGATGLTIVLVLSHIAWPIRYWGCRLLQRAGLRLACPLYCSMCSGVWVGAGVGLVAGGGWLHVLEMAFSTSLVAFLASTWLRDHGECTGPEHDQQKAERR